MYRLEDSLVHEVTLPWSPGLPRIERGFGLSGPGTFFFADPGAAAARVLAAAAASRKVRAAGLVGCVFA